MPIRLDINKGANDIYSPNTQYVEVYSEGELIGNVTIEQIKHVLDIATLMLAMNDYLKTNEILKQNGII